MQPVIDWKVVMVAALERCGFIDPDFPKFTGEIKFSLADGGVKYVSVTETVK
jgi:hypothetical protein